MGGVPGQVHPPGRFTPRQVHPRGRYNPTPSRYYEIQSMSGRYASDWNAFLFAVVKTFDAKIYIIVNFVLIAKNLNIKQTQKVCSHMTSAINTVSVVTDKMGPEPILTPSSFNGFNRLYDGTYISIRRYFVTILVHRRNTSKLQFFLKHSRFPKILLTQLS